MFNNLPESVKNQILSSIDPNISATSYSQQIQNIKQPQSVSVSGNLQSIQNSESKLSKFGYDFFSSSVESFAPINDIPIPSDYILSIGDVLEIFLKGEVNTNYTLQISRMGQSTFPRIGEIFLANISLSEARELIINKVEENLIETDVVINLKSLNFFTVYLLGAVNNPGSYFISPFTSTSNFIKIAGGISNYGSLRNVLVKSLNGEEYSIDLYDLLIYGDRENDRRLRSGDTIFVPPTSSFIAATGMVNRPAIYEFKSSDTFKDLLTFAQGPAEFADLERIEIGFYDEGKLNYSILSESMADNINIDNAKTLFIPFNNPDVSSNLKVFGPISDVGPNEITGNQIR